MYSNRRETGWAGRQAETIFSQDSCIAAFIDRLLTVVNLRVWCCPVHLSHETFSFQDTPKSGKVGKSGGQENSEHEVG